MTLENCKYLLAHYKKSIDDSSLSGQARLNAKRAYANMLKNLASRGVSPELPKNKRVLAITKS